MAAWDEGGQGVMRLPSGRSVRGRGLRRPLPVGQVPAFGLYLLGGPPPETAWSARWVRWRDFWLPSDPAGFRDELVGTLRRAGDERVEVACGGGIGRTGTALACLAILDGVRSDEAVAYVRSGYHPRAVETPWQRRFVERFGAG
ncbi:protein-tyrosine phosphatase family protein [Catellatospora methionotrophica]|uniref:protein-tyrosine phosphatase family protein n=1 Tax=Catellatospora methionotrophica TaxID=121620 RepID=UPI0033C397A8